MYGRNSHQFSVYKQVFNQRSCKQHLCMNRYQPHKAGFHDKHLCELILINEVFIRFKPSNQVVIELATLIVTIFISSLVKKMND